MVEMAVTSVGMAGPGRSVLTFSLTLYKLLTYSFTARTA